MQYLLPDGNLVKGRGYTDIVKQMNEEKFTPAQNIATYRKALAKRVKSIYGKDVDYTTDKSLVKGLVEVGLLTPTTSL